MRETSRTATPREDDREHSGRYRYPYSTAPTYEIAKSRQIQFNGFESFLTDRSDAPQPAAAGRDLQHSRLLRSSLGAVAG